MQLLEEDFDLINFMSTQQREQIESFEGKYHHLKLNWRAVYLNRPALTDLIINAFENKGYSQDDCRSFIAQIIFAIVDGGLELEQKLLTTAFG